MSTTEADWLTFEGVPFSETSFAGVWVLAAAAYGGGDVATTVALVWFDPLYVEANPVVSAAIEAFGGGGFLALKLTVFYACLAISLWGGVGDDDTLMFYGPPLALVAFGLATTGSNLALLL